MDKKTVNQQIINGLSSKGINIAEIELNHLEAFADIMYKAINYSQCCTQLKDKEALTFDEYAKKFYKKTPEEYYVSKIVKNHEITKNDLQEEYNNYCLNF